MSDAVGEVRAAHAAAVHAWRRQREERLRDPESWLSLVGLEWLHPGENRVGSGPAAEVSLRAAAAPRHAGSVFVEDGAVRFVAAPGAGVSCDGQPVGELALADDREAAPRSLAIGSLRLQLIRRGQRLAIRVRDRAAAALTAFDGIECYPVDPAWRLRARLVPTPGRTVPVADVVGGVSDEPSPGTVLFERDGTEHRLDALEGDATGGLWLVFGDATNGQQTYAGGRFLYTEPPDRDGFLSADFNLAYNPPCVFSPFATCPLPWARNVLPIPVEAGEKSYSPSAEPDRGVAPRARLGA